MWAGLSGLMGTSDGLLVMNLHSLKDVSRTGEEETGTVLQVIQCCQFFYL
jgi:hypothetical protein